MNEAELGEQMLAKRARAKLPPGRIENCCFVWNAASQRLYIYPSGHGMNIKSCNFELEGAPFKIFWGEPPRA